MRKWILFPILLFVATVAYGQPLPSVSYTEEDGSPEVWSPYQIKFANGLVTDNADGTVSVASGGGGTECSTSACDLHADTELNTQGICLANGTDCPADTIITAGDGLTLTGTDIDFDGGSSPSGILSGTWAAIEIDALGITENHLAASLVFDDADLLDFGTFVTGATEGIMLPAHATDCTTATAEGQVCWEEDAKILYVGDGTAAVAVGPGAAVETNSLEVVATSAATNEVFVGTGADAGAYITIEACGSNEKIEYTDAAPNTFTCETIALTDAEVSNTLTASIIDLEAGTITNIETTEIMIGVGAADASYVALSSEATMDNTGAVTLADSVTVTGWTMGASAATTPAEGDNDTSLATTAFVLAETADILDGTDAFTAFNGNDIIINEDIDDDGNFVFTGNWDFGGSSNFEIPQDQTVNAIGEVTVDETSGQFRYYANGAENVTAPFYEMPKSLEDPVEADDDIPFWHPKQAITITDVYCEVEGATSIGVIISDGTNALEEVICTEAGAADDGSITNGTFAANERMEVDMGTISGTPDWVSWTITYTIDAD
jgi:hypothetical protein